MHDRPTPRHLTASGWLRSMGAGESGGSQPHLFDTEDGAYMVKTSNNPQGAMVLPNELVGGLCLDWLGVRHPESAIVDVAPEVITDSPSASFTTGQPLAAGPAFGSKYWPSDPMEAVPVEKLTNRADIAGTLAFDTWVQPGDSRQYRVRRAESEADRYEYVPVDQGFSIGNPSWTVSQLDGNHEAVTVPSLPVTLLASDVCPFIDRLRLFSTADAEHIVSQVPADWLDDEQRAGLGRYLVARAAKAADALAQQYPELGGP